MDEFIQIALFLLFALFSLGSNLLKKRREQKAKEQVGEEEYEESGGRPPRRAEVSSPDEPEDSRQFTSFEDILRELTGEKPRRERPKRKPEPRQEAEDVEEAYDHPFSNKKIQEAEQKAERKVAQKVEPLRQYKQKAKKYQGHVAQKISDKIKIDDASPAKKLVVKKAATKKKNKQLARSITASLKNPKSARKAIILSEILNRKHF